MKKIIICLVYLISLSVSSNTVISSSSDLQKNNKVILTVAVEDEGYYPYNYELDDKRVGFSIDVLNYFEQHTNYEFEFIILPWPRAIHLVSVGKVDLILTLFKTSKREGEYHFIEPSYGDEANQLFSLVDKEIEFTGQIPELASYSIGTVREYSYGDRFDQASYLTKLPALTEAILLKLLLGNRVDVAISNPLAFSNVILKHNAQNRIKAIEPYVEITPVYMALTKQRSDAQKIKDTLGRVTKELKSTSYYQTLLKKYKINFR
ncbi:substrate-binding periplasmic protein [Paraglaciecola sp.]|uniref:substrate-binding periplasmic protein n=1 Tax=Paraglaciecola sp. TaxID=1920173 RepID=UPI003EF7A48D